MKQFCKLSFSAIERRSSDAEGFFPFDFFVSVFLFAKSLIFDHHYIGHRIQFN